MLELNALLISLILPGDWWLVCITNLQPSTTHTVISKQQLEHQL